MPPPRSAKPPAGPSNKDAKESLGETPPRPRPEDANKLSAPSEASGLLISLALSLLGWDKFLRVLASKCWDKLSFRLR